MGTSDLRVLVVVGAGMLAAWVFVAAAFRGMLF
jgi:hypothetical protein